MASGQWPERWSARAFTCAGPRRERCNLSAKADEHPKFAAVPGQGDRSGYPSLPSTCEIGLRTDHPAGQNYCAGSHGVSARARKISLGTSQISCAGRIVESSSPIKDSPNNPNSAVWLTFDTLPTPIHTPDLIRRKPKGMA